MVKRVLLGLPSGQPIVLQTNYTGSQIKAFKSPETYNYFVYSWLSDLGPKAALNDCRLVFVLVSKCDSKPFPLDVEAAEPFY